LFIFQGYRIAREPPLAVWRYDLPEHSRIGIKSGGVLYKTCFFDSGRSRKTDRDNEENDSEAVEEPSKAKEA
jgi:hypothetical protein